MDLIVDRLGGKHVTLEPVEERHRTGLEAVCADPDLWRYMPRPAAGDGFDIWFKELMEAYDNKKEIPFAVRDNRSGELVGSTRFLNLALEHDRIEIGHTFYARAVWGTRVNPEAKLLLMSHAFGTMGAHRVEFRCDAKNARSRSAIEKLGAKFEGILREEKLLRSGGRRDTAVYAVLKPDWPEVKAGLERRLEA